MKKIIAFVHVSSDRGEYIAKVLKNSLLEWGLKNVFTITLDNALSNDSAMSFFKKKIEESGRLFGGAFWQGLIGFSKIGLRICLLG